MNSLTLVKSTQVRIPSGTSFLEVLPLYFPTSTGLDAHSLSGAGSIRPCSMAFLVHCSKYFLWQGPQLGRLQ